MACWLRTSPHSQPASLPSAPKSQTQLAFEKHSLCLFSPSQMHSVAKYFIGSFQNAPCLNAGHWLILQSQQPAPRSSFWDNLWVTSVCQSGVAGVLPGVVGLQLFHLAIQRAQQRSPNLCQEQGHASSAIWCIVVVAATDPHSAHAFVAHALQGPSPARTAQHPRLWDITLAFVIQHLCSFYFSIQLLILQHWATADQCWYFQRVAGCRNYHIWYKFGHNWRMRAYVWVLVGSAQRRKKQCSFARQTYAHASPCCRLTFCHQRE